MTNLIKFTTDRNYSETQTITAWIVEGTTEQDDFFGQTFSVQFKDEGRNISGQMNHVTDLSKSTVMAVYDNGSYTPMTVEVPQ